MSENLALTISVILLLPTLLAGIPISFSMITAALAFFILTASDASIIPTNMFWFLNKSELLSIPFFILAADLLGKSRATEDLINAAEAIFGRMRGGLAMVAMVATIVFSAISGSSVATAIAIGRVMIPKLIEGGYRRQFSVGLIAAGGGLGILIPPSVPLIIFSTVAEISVGDVFLVAIGPGLVLGFSFCLYIYLVGDRMRSGKNLLKIEVAASSSDIVRLIARAAPVIALPFLILGGIYGGVFTPTEAASVSVIYSASLALTFYRKSDMQPALSIISDAGQLAAVVLFIMAATSVFGYIVTINQIPLSFSQFVQSWGPSLVVFLLCTNLMLLALGCFLEIISVILITVPILLPVILDFGMDPIHFGILVVINMELAVITPPIGMNLFVISAISKVPILKVFQGTIPFVILIALILILVTYSENFATLSKYFF